MHAAWPTRGLNRLASLGTRHASGDSIRRGVGLGRIRRIRGVRISCRAGARGRRRPSRRCRREIPARSRHRATCQSRPARAYVPPTPARTAILTDRPGRARQEATRPVLNGARFQATARPGALIRAPLSCQLTGFSKSSGWPEPARWPLCARLCRFCRTADPKCCACGRGCPSSRRPSALQALPRPPASRTWWQRRT